jgi:hypothetical protein
MTPELEKQNIEDEVLFSIERAIEKGEIFSADGEKFLSIKQFNPEKDKGVYLVAEGQNPLSQYLLETSKEGETSEREIFVKKLRSKEKAITEETAYTRCKEKGIPTLNLVASIDTPEGYFTITETENYLVPYSRLQIKSKEQFSRVLNNGLDLIKNLNNIGIIHRDTLTRNIGILTNSPNLSLIFDFETSLVLDEPATEKQRTQEENLFTESLFFQMLEQNSPDSQLIREIKEEYGF